MRRGAVGVDPYTLLINIWNFPWCVRKRVSVSFFQSNIAICVLKIQMLFLACLCFKLVSTLSTIIYNIYMHCLPIVSFQVFVYPSVITQIAPVGMTFMFYLLVFHVKALFTDLIVPCISNNNPIPKVWWMVPWLIRRTIVCVRMRMTLDVAKSTCLFTRLEESSLVPAGFLTAQFLQEM